MLSMIFGEGEKCPMCKEIVNIYISDKDMEDRFIRTINSIMTERQEIARNSFQLNQMRGAFWFSVVLAGLWWVIYTLLSMALKDFDRINAFNSAVVITPLAFGILYVFTYFVVVYYKWKRTKNTIKKEIESMVNIVEKGKE